MFKVQPWMLGVGVVAVGGIGIAIYEVVQSKKAPVAPATPAIPGTVASSAPPPVITPTRPTVSSGAGTFSTNAPPTGPQFTVQPGTFASPLSSGQSITLVLPAGASWGTVLVGNSTTHGGAQVGLGSDLTSPFSLSTTQLLGMNTIVADWKDSSGNAQQTTVTLPLVVAVQPVTLHF
jgi:hypothetical protein